MEPAYFKLAFLLLIQSIMKSKSNFKDYINAYFRTLSIIFFALFIIYALLSIGSKDYLTTLTSLIATNILPVVSGNVVLAIIYFYIQKKAIK
jgi:branched-subunit amino acid transport protein AzlD